MNALILFKNNLRVLDNPVLFHGSNDNYIIPVYIHDELYINKKLGSSSRYWMHNALVSLNIYL